MRRSPLRENAKKNLEKNNVISFAYGYPPTEAFPMEVLKEISNYLYDEVKPEKYLQYGPTEGIADLREKVKKHLVTANGFSKLKNISQQNILITSGSSQAIDLVVRVLCNEGDIVLCEEQTFSGAVNCISSYGAIPEPVEFDSKQQSMKLDVLEKRLQEDLEHKIKMIYVIPTFQNPMGTSMPKEARKKMYEIAQKYHVMIFEDDPYGELLYKGEMIPKIKSFDEEGIVIYGGSFSKVLAPATRLGYVLADDNILEKMTLAKQVADSHSNLYWQNVIAEYIENYHFDEHVEKLRVLYSEKLKVMEEELDRISTKKMTYIKPTGGYFVCCKMADEVNEDIFLDKLDEYNVSVIPGNIMSVTGKGYEKYIRLNFTKPTLAEIKQGVAAINDALNLAYNE